MYISWNQIINWMLMKLQLSILAKTSGVYCSVFSLQSLL